MTYLPLGAHLVGSVPLGSAEDVFRTLAGAARRPAAAAAGRRDRAARRLDRLAVPRPQLATPSSRSPRRHPASTARCRRCALRRQARSRRASRGSATRTRRSPRTARSAGSSATACSRAAAASRSACRHRSRRSARSSRPTTRPRSSRAYEAAMAREVEQILDGIPHDQLALQWDTNFEFGLLEGAFPLWFARREGRHARAAAADLAARAARRRARLPLLLRRRRAGAAARAGAIWGGSSRSRTSSRRASARRSTGCTCRCPIRSTSRRRCASSGCRPRPSSTSEPYASGDARVEERLDGAHALAGEFGIATPCGWGRMAAAAVPDLLDAHARLSRPVARPSAGPPFAWPEGFERIPADEWVDAPVDAFGLHYDTVENHGWYRNLDLTVEQLARDLEPATCWSTTPAARASWSTGCACGSSTAQVGMMIVDSSPKFLRVALDRFRADPRVGFRLLRFLRDERRLQYLDEVLPEGFAGPTGSSRRTRSTSTTTSRTRSVLGARAAAGRRRLRQLRQPAQPARGRDEWIIDETVYVVHEVATGLVRTDPRCAAYRDVLDDAERMRAHLAWRDRVFLAPRPLAYYTEQLSAPASASTTSTSGRSRPRWRSGSSSSPPTTTRCSAGSGGSAKVDGEPASEEAAADRLGAHAPLARRDLRRAAARSAAAGRT